ncbi:MAG: hypothetical protein DMG67_14925 [Acidobacteria bacterium]|nr:MAG: hypothetical protein DMG67_14925 [Acidobacteriota bacterium]
MSTKQLATAITMARLSPPDKQDAHHGDVGVPIRHRLAADLHQADHRHQSPQEIEPAHGKIRTAFPLAQHQHRDHRKQQARECRFP